MSRIETVEVGGTEYTLGADKNSTVTFTEAQTRTNITSGESLATMFGKIKKWFTDININWNADIGEIRAYMRKTAPEGYLKCDGTTYYIADYPLLADLFLNDFGAYNYFGGNGTTTFGVPDLRGEFLRGTGTNGHSNQGSGATVGTHQNSTSIPMFYTSKSSGGVNIGYRISGDASVGDSNGIANGDSSLTGSVASTYGMNLGGTQGTSSNKIYSYYIRPTNTSVLYCIRAY